MKLRWSVKQGGINVETYTKSTCSHYYYYYCCCCCYYYHYYVDVCEHERSNLVCPLSPSSYTTALSRARRGDPPTRRVFKLHRPSRPATFTPNTFDTPEDYDRQDELLIQVTFIVQELCESRGGRPGLSVLTSLLVSVDVKNYWTVLRHWSQLVPNMSNDIWGH